MISLNFHPCEQVSLMKDVQIGSFTASNDRP
jgi:hypothetical protein